MNYYLLRMKTYGMKNIEEEITIDFYKETIGKKMNFKDYNVKAIYGSNGAGKTAIIQSVNLYKNITINPLYLYQNEIIDSLNNLINKRKKEFYINMIFCVIEKNYSIYSHEIKVNLKKGTPVITNEKISKLVGNTLNSDYELLLEIKDDKIIYSKASQWIDYFNLNLKSLNNKSFVTYCKGELFDNYSKNNTLVKDKVLEALLDTSSFGKMIIVKVGNSELSSNDYYSLFEDDKDNLGEYHSNIKIKVDIVNKKDAIKYQEDVIGLYYFLKIFKPSLVDIKIARRVVKDKYYYTKTLVYNDYEIDPLFESSGIKNLIELYSSLKMASYNRIVFIDELDVNINGVHLTKLVEYFIEYANGQICFTTHNVSPMGVLKNKKESINFLNNYLKIVNWVKNGHYSPANMYEKGLISGLIFNVEAWDFLKAFNNED